MTRPHERSPVISPTTTIPRNCAHGATIGTSKNGNKMAKSQLNKLIKHCAKTEGAKAEVLRRLNKAGILSNWATVSSWLHSDPAKRREPRAENMESALKIQKQMCG